MEATCYIAIDIIFIQCRKYIRQKHNPAKAKTTILTTPSTPLKSAFNLPAKTPRKFIKLYPESTIFVEVCSQSTLHKMFLISSCADWAVRYSSNAENGILLVALKAK